VIEPLAVQRPTNNLGLRMAEDVGPKRPDESRILVLGDSFAEGVETSYDEHADAGGDASNGRRHGVYDRRFDGIAENLLKRRSAEWRSWTIVNAAIQNGSPVQYLLMLRWLLPIVQPDVVVIVTGSNDLFDDMEFERRYGFDLDTQGVPLRPHRRLQLWLLQKSFLLRYVDVLLTRFAPRIELSLFPYWDDSLVPLPWNTLSCTLRPEAVQAFEQKTGRYLVELDKMSASAGASLGVLVTHYLYSFRNEPFYEPRFPWLKPELVKEHCYEANARPYVEVIDSFLERNGIPYRDTYAAFAAAKAAEPSRKLWNFYDYHFSARGHELLGSEVAELVVKLRWPSGPPG
jgi:lysophospholipase L1-like esterase